MPEASSLAKLRRSIDRRPHEIKAVLSSSGIRKEYLGGVAKDEGKVVKRFIAEHAETSLKTKPKVSNQCIIATDLLRVKTCTILEGCWCDLFGLDRLICAAIAPQIQLDSDSRLGRCAR